MPNLTAHPHSSIAVPARHAPDGEWVAAGWGPAREWRARAADAQPLVLSLRLPRGWEHVELPTGSAEPGSTSPIAGPRMPGAITTQLLTLRLDRDGDTTPVIVAATFALTALPGASGSIEGGQHVTIGGDEGVRTRRRTTADLAWLPAPVPTLVIGFLLRTEHGTLSMSFASPQPGVHAAVEPVIDAIAATAQLTPALRRTTEGRPR